MTGTLQLRTAIVVAALTPLLWVAMGCSAPYHPPANATPQSVATVRGPIMGIDRKSVAPAVLGVVPSNPVQVEPGTHQFIFGGYFGQLTIPLQVTAGNSYEFGLETYLDSTRLKMRNETTNRTTYFDATKQTYYDDANHFLPKPTTGAFAP